MPRADLDITVAYTVTVRPLDTATVRAIAGERVAIVEPYLEGTSLAPLAEALADRPRRFLAIGVPNHEHRHYGSRLDHLRALRLDRPGIRSRLDAWLAPR